jgi:hypothetical protein
MCEKCVEACQEIFPEQEDEWGNMLMNFTAFPFADPERIREQLKHLKEVGPKQVMEEIDKEMEDAVKEAKKKNE